MHPKTRNRTLSCLAAFAAVAAVAASSAPQAAHAEMLGHGPVLLAGYSPDEDASGTAQDLGILAAGWRWTYDGADWLDGALARVGTEFSWAVEPLVGVEFGDAEAFEASVVPFARFAPAGWDGVVPFLEGGIGIAYTGLRNYGLGSRVHFSDNVGVGVEFDAADMRWSVGYRFRHLSHAGILSKHNDGLNAHFLAITVSM
jgi:opacity protein-like surface antigen